MEKCDKCGEFIEFVPLCPLCAHCEKERLKRSAKKCEERAEKAEELARELVGALDIAVKEMLFAGAFCVVVDRRITRVMIKVLTKAKEVLGDDN